MGYPPITTIFILATAEFNAKAATPAADMPLMFVFTPATRETCVYARADNVLDPADVTDGTITVTGVSPVGGTTYPPNKLLMLAPWIALGAAIIVGISLLVRKCRSAMR